jgi:hypothetical protein
MILQCRPPRKTVLRDNPGLITGIFYARERGEFLPDGWLTREAKHRAPVCLRSYIAKRTAAF